MLIVRRAGRQIDRQRSLFEASGLRLAQAVHAAIAADLQPFWLDEATMNTLWRKAAQAPTATILPSGRVLAVLSSGAPYALHYLNLNRDAMHRATLGYPDPLLLLARAIDRVLEDVSGPPPSRLEYVAYYHTNGRIQRTQGSTVPEEYSRPIGTLQRLKRLASG